LKDWVEKQFFHLEGLELEEHTEKMKERVPTEEEDPREAPHETLRPPITIDKENPKKFTIKA
jgi:hypothetical protein